MGADAAISPLSFPSVPANSYLQIRTIVLEYPQEVGPGPLLCLGACRYMWTGGIRRETPCGKGLGNVSTPSIIREWVRPEPLLL